MSNIFKGVGRGILYFFFFPFILAGIAITGVVGLGVFCFQFVKMIVLFFSGRSLSSDIEEDIQAKAILGEIKLEEEEKKEDNPLSLYPSNSPVYGSGYSSPLFEEKKEEENEEKEDEDNVY